jgi:hypothetical protein
MSTGVDPARTGAGVESTGTVRRKRWATPRVIMSELASQGVGVKPTNVSDAADEKHTTRPAS